MKRKFNGLKKLMAIALGFSVFACHDPSEIGFGLGEDELITALYTDTVSLGYSTVMSDSAVNGSLRYILSGNITDPQFGKTEAVAYIQPSFLPQLSSSGTVVTNDNGVSLFDTLILKNNPLPDSLILSLYCDGVTYGDTNAISKFKVHRLREAMPSRNLDATEKLAYDPTPLAEFEFNLPGLRHDSTRALMPKFVKLPKELTAEVIRVASEAKGNNTAFLNNFRGFAIVPDKNNKAVYGFKTGQIEISSNFSVIPTSSLFSYWHYEGDTTSQVYRFLYNGPRHSSLTFDRSGTALASLTKSNNELPLNSTAGNLYLQAGSGISPKVDLKAVSNLGKIKVVRAMLEFRLNTSTINNLYRKNYYTVLAETGANNQQKRGSSNNLVYLNGRVQDAVVGNYTVLNDSTNFLDVDITSYLQKLVDAGNTDKQLLLLPAFINSTSGAGVLGNDNLSRLVFLKPRLLLYYTRY